MPSNPSPPPSDPAPLDLRRPPVRAPAWAGAALLALGALLAVAPGARAASRAPPSHQRLVAADGRTCLLVTVQADPARSTFTLVARAPEAPPPAPAQRGLSEPGFAPEPGERVLARVEAATPVQARCLDAAAGWVTVDEFASPGRGKVAERRDAAGAVLWSKSLADLFTAEQRAAFPELFGTLAWCLFAALDRAAGDLVLVSVTGAARRLGLTDGGPRAVPDPAALILAQAAAAGDGGEAAQRAALLFAAERGLAHLPEALERALADPATSRPLRALAAERLLARADSDAALEHLLAAMASTEAGVRAWAAQVLTEQLPARAPALRKKALERLRALDSAEARAAVQALPR